MVSSLGKLLTCHFYSVYLGEERLVQTFPPPALKSWHRCPSAAFQVRRWLILLKCSRIPTTDLIPPASPTAFPRLTFLCLLSLSYGWTPACGVQRPVGGREEHAAQEAHERIWWCLRLQRLPWVYTRPYSLQIMFSCDLDVVAAKICQTWLYLDVVACHSYTSKFGLFGTNEEWAMSCMFYRLSDTTRNPRPGEENGKGRGLLL